MRQSYPISREQYDTWLESSVTKRLFADLTDVICEEADNVGGSTIDGSAISAIRFKACMELCGEVIEWKPDELKGKDK